MNSESVTPSYNQLKCISLFVTTASHSISVPHENSPWTEYRKRPPVLLQFYLKHPLITHLQLHIFLFNKIWNAMHIHVPLSRTDALIHPDILFRYAVMFYTTISYKRLFLKWVNVSSVAIHLHLYPASMLAEL